MRRESDNIPHLNTKASEYQILLVMLQEETDKTTALSFFRWGTHLYMSLFLPVYLSVADHIHGAIHHLIIIFGTLV